VGDSLRELWDFNDLVATETRLRDALDSAVSDPDRAEILTQLARVEGLRDRFDAGLALNDRAEQLAGSAPRPSIRVKLERGRLHRSSGLPEKAAPLFVSAFEQAVEHGELALAADAAHMAALVDDMETWTQRGLEIANGSTDPGVTRWAGPLYNNLGWDRYDHGDFEGALQAFEAALREYQKPPDRPAEVQIAREAVEEARRALTPYS
jgi:tetratricopeptide (TPR) repeat protein